MQKAISTDGTSIANHDVAPEVLAPVLLEFFKASTER